MLTRSDLEHKRERAYTVESVLHPDPAKCAKGERVDVRLRNMFGGEWVSLIRSTTGKDKAAQWRNDNIGGLVLAFCLVDESGKRILTDDDLNTAWWRSQSIGFTTDAVEAAMRFSGVRPSTTVEDERKNLPTTGDSSNTTESPPSSDMEVPAIVSTTLE
jgi:hypothetical protein